MISIANCRFARLFSAKSQIFTVCFPQASQYIWNLWLDYTHLFSLAMIFSSSARDAEAASSCWLPTHSCCASLLTFFARKPISWRKEEFKTSIPSSPYWNWTTDLQVTNNCGDIAKVGIRFEITWTSAWNRTPELFSTRKLLCSHKPELSSSSHD